MAYQRSLRRRLTLAVGLLANTLILLPLAALAAPSDTIPPELRLVMARDAEKDGNWAEACVHYDALLALNRDQPKLKERFLFCLRNFHRCYRHQDPSYQQLFRADFKERFTITQAVDFYKEALRKVQDNYLNSDKATLTRLFREGVEELSLFLDDASLSKQYVGKPENVPTFRNYLRSKHDIKVADLADAEKQLREVAREAIKSLHLNPRVVIMEFACGACNALDEYSFYLTQGYLGGVGGMDRGSSVEAKMHEEKGIGYIHIAYFDDTTVADLEAAYEALRAGGMKVLLLDLRDNAGGSLDVAVQVTERFLAAPHRIGSVSGKINKELRSSSMAAADLPIFVLIDGRTASAAELVAAAFKASKRAELIGQTTYGKSWIQQTLPISQAPYGAIRLTWAQFYGPDKQDLSKTGGVTPTVPVSSPDRLLDAALERARPLVMVMR